MEDFKLKLEYNKKLAYSILDEQTKTEKFANEEQFEKFINENKDTYYNIELKSIEQDIKNEYIEYRYTDMKNNIYVIKRSNALEYKIYM